MPRRGRSDRWSGREQFADGDGVKVIFDASQPAATLTGPTHDFNGDHNFNGDGKSDMLWQNDNGTPAIWLMNGLNPIGAATVGPNLQIDCGSERRWRGFATNWPK